MEVSELDIYSCILPSILFLSPDPILQIGIIILGEQSIGIHFYCSWNCFMEVFVINLDVVIAFGGNKK